MNKLQTYRCNRNCPIRKNCFIIKLKEPLPTPVTVLFKCKATKSDVEVTIGPDQPP